MKNIFFSFYNIITDKRKISASWKIYIQRATASAAAHYTSGVTTCELVVLPSWHCFRNPDALDPRLCFVPGTWYVMSGSDRGRHSKSCCKAPLGSIAASTARQISRGPATSSNTRVWDVLCHIPGIIKSRRRGDERMWYSPFTIHVISRLTLTWAASLGWTSAVSCSNIYREYHAPVLWIII